MEGFESFIGVDFWTALFILLNPNTAMNIVWGFMGVSIILEAGLEIATIILLK